MQDKNAKAPSQRHGDNINPVVATVVKVATLVVVAALVVLLTLIAVELLKKDKTETEPFADRINITYLDFKGIVEGEDHTTLSVNVYEIMKETTEDQDIYFFFYYSNLFDKIDDELAEVVGNRDKDAVIFVVNLYLDLSNEELTGVDTVQKYMLTNEHLIDIEIETYFNSKLDGELKYPYFLLVFNEEKLNSNQNPFTLITNSEVMLETVKALPIKEEE